ncbi:hypothetical protein PHMEG_00016582 [Phytophthora megakarya]|uniref:Uncharacterized protein n=1 Tax=Phytophthora megakarya TaxID=4795 RepID=A0A225W016_9STRA|nr:hypothetical protein PHMEG_00016582 [Phytophthora megakarya]
MACTSPNQWALTSPTTSSSSRRQDEVSDVDHEEQAEDEMFNHVRQLIVDLLKLARVLMELAGEQENLRMAANAGNTLLEELSTAREEIDMLHDELEAVQVDRDRSLRESLRLREQNAALETELQRYDAPYGAWNCIEQNALSHMQQRRSSLSSRPGSFSRADSCEQCASREVEMTQLEQRADELRRRCLESELAREREQQRQRELAEEIAQLQQRNKEQHLETGCVQQDLEFVTTQLDRQTQEIESVQAVRDTLRRTARRLEAENEDLRERLTVREELVVQLENSKARAATQLQVAENRTASAQAETKRVTETLEQLQKHLENILHQQVERESSTGRSSEAAMEACEKKSDDMEQLLEDATREVAALRLENRILRRQNSAETSPDESRARSRRRKTMCTGSATMTAADVLALGTREPQREDTASVSSKSDSGSEFESTSTSRTQLPLLEIDTIKSAPVSIATPEEILSGDGKKRRKMSLELNWIDKDVTPNVQAASSSGLKRPTSLSRLSHANDHCVISCATGVDSPEVSLFKIEGKQSTRRSIVDGVRAREVPIDELKREAIESPPKSPLYFGLSFIACATAATAAGLLVRR